MDPAHQMLGHDPAHKLAAVYAGQFFLRDKLQLDRARDRAGDTHRVTRLTARVRSGPAVVNDMAGEAMSIFTATT